MAFLRKIFNAFSKTEKVFFFTAVFLATFSAVALLISWAAGKTYVVPASGGEYVEGVVGQPVFVNPVLAANEADKNLVRLLFSNVGDLADKIEMSQNGRVWNVRLKEGLVWSNNEKLTSDDIVFTVQKIQDSDTQSPLFSNWQGVAVNRLSELEAQFNLAAPYAFFGDNLKNLYVLPKHLFADTPSPNWRLSEFNLKPVGSGPYVFVSYEKRPDGFITAYHLTPNQRYFAAKPFIRKFSFKFFTKIEDALKEFNLGKIDGFFNLEPQITEEIKRPYASFVFSFPGYYAVFLNQNQNLAFKDEVVREALNLAVDRKVFMDEIFKGRGVGAKGPVVAYAEEETASSSPALAMELLEKNGWHVATSTLIREKAIKGGKITLEFDITVPQTGFLMQTAKKLKGLWEEAGFRVNIISLPSEDIAQGPIRNRDYQALLFGNIFNSQYDLFSFWHSSERFYPGLNLALYKNTSADKLIESIRQNLNEEKRMTQLRELNRIIRADTPAIFLYSPQYLFVATKDLKDVKDGLVGEPAERFADAKNWYLRTTRALKR